MQTIRPQFQGRRVMRMASASTCTPRSVRRSSIPGSVYLLVLACISISISISIPTAHAFSTKKWPSIRDGRTSFIGLPAVSTISSRSLSTPTTTTGRPTWSTSTALRFASLSTTTMGTSRRSIPQSSPIARCRRRRHHRSTISTGSPSTRTRTRTIRRTSSSSSSSSLVTEDNVLEAVEEAEQLWAQALDARKTANALSDRAEEGAEAAAATTLQIDATFQTSKQERIPIRMEDLAKADAAAKSNLDAGSMVNRAMQASEEAEEMERVAEVALQRSEKRLEQHLQDFPDSALAQ